MSNIETPDLLLGGLYKADWDNRPFRVIGFDAIEVFYDCLWPGDNRWTFSGNFKKKASFYRMSSQIFLSRSQQIEMLPLTTDEYNAFRPDLSMRLGRTKMLSWNTIESSSYLEFSTRSNKYLSNLTEQSLEVDKIMLLPYGPKGGLKKGSVVQADNGVNFSVNELLWKAKQIQEVVNSEKSAGIGLYRLGFEKSIPSYYIGEYIDQARICEE